MTTCQTARRCYHPRMMKQLAALGLKIDDVLIDRVFQPIVNRTFKHPVDLSNTASIGGSVLLAAGCVWSAVNTSGATSVFSAATALLNLSPLIYIRTGQPNMRRLIQPGLANPFRELLRPARWTQVVGSIFIVSFYVLVETISPDPTILTFPLGMALCACSAFFLACACPPAKPAPKRRENPNPILRRAAAAYR